MTNTIIKPTEEEFTLRELEIMRLMFTEYDFEELIIADSRVTEDEINFLIDKIEEKQIDVALKEDC